MAASSLVELLFVQGVVPTPVSTGVVQVTTSIDSICASAAARHVSSRLQQPRVRAITHNRAMALRVTLDARGYLVEACEDCNDSDVLAADIQNGIDTRIASALAADRAVRGRRLRGAARSARRAGQGWRSMGRRVGWDRRPS